MVQARAPTPPETGHAFALQPDACALRIAFPCRGGRGARAGGARPRRRKSIARLANALPFCGFSSCAHGKGAAREKMDGRAAPRQLQDSPRQARNQASPGYLLDATCALTCACLTPASGRVQQIIAQQIIEA